MATFCASRKLRMPMPAEALSGRPDRMPIPGTEQALFGMGYAGGLTPNPTYKEVHRQDSARRAWGVQFATKVGASR